MKPAPVLLAVSIAANLALLGVLLLRPKPPAPELPAERAPGPSVSSDGAAKNAVSLQAALNSGDAVALAAAGVPAETIRALTIGRAFDIFQARMRALLRPGPADERYWRRFPSDRVISRERRLDASKADRDFSEAIRTAYGEDDFGALFSGRDDARSGLAAEKREQLRRIERDYADMEQQIYADGDQSAGIQLPSDREKLKMLREEKERDVAAALTPAEREMLDLRDSSAARSVRNQFGDILQTEEEYRKIFALQKAFEDQFRNADGRPSSEQARARTEAEQKLDDDIRQALGPDKWAAAQRANDQDGRVLEAVARRLNLPPTTADQVLALRDRVAVQSMQINADAALSAAERKTQLQALATKVQADLTAALGPEGGPAFGQQANWVGLLRNGQAYSLNPRDAQTTGRAIGTRAYPVPPPKAEAPPPRN